MAAAGALNQDIARRLGVSRPTVQLWRQRFLALRLPGLVKDAPRPGRTPRISARKVALVVEATLHTTPPQATHWSVRSMAEAQGISRMAVQRIWKRHHLKPHLVKTFKLSRDKQFLQKLTDGALPRRRVRHAGGQVQDDAVERPDDADAELEQA